MNRRGDWMQTYTGKVFWPLDPRAEEVDLEDIAHALSQLCRFGGHTTRFYSVAEHSVYVSHFVPPELALTALLHDATEAYVIDVPRPLKPWLSEYKAIEDGVWTAVAVHFGLPQAMPPEVKQADTAVLLAERDQIMRPPAMPWTLEGKAAPVQIVGYTPGIAKELFLARYRFLT